MRFSVQVVSDGGDVATLDCAWLAGDNCWRTTANAAASCLPPASESGVLSPDGRTCTYASGAVIVFNTPLVLPTPDNPTWDFTIKNGGQDCLHFEDDNHSFKLTVSGQTVTESVSSAAGISISCPDGRTYSNSNAIELISCNPDATVFGNLPGDQWSGSGTRVRFGLAGAPSSSMPVPALFDCAR